MFRTLCMLVGCLVLSSAAFAEMGKTISVVGYAEQELEPDMATLNMVIEQVHAQSEQSRAAVQQDIRRLSQELSRLGLAGEHLTQSHIFQGKKNRWEQGKQHHVGYYSQVNLKAEVKDLDLLIPIYDTLAKFESLRIQSTQFKLSDRQQQEDKLVGKALVHAQEKAKLVLQGVNQRPGDLLRMVEDSALSPHPMPRFKAEAAAMDAGSSDGGGPGFSSIKLSATVTATFDIQD